MLLYTHSILDYLHTRVSPRITFNSDLTNPLPLPPSARARRTLLLLPLTPLLLRIQHQIQHIEPKLWELQTHPLELLLRLVTQDMTPRRPESGDRFSYTLVVGTRLFVHEARVCDLALGCGLCEVDFLVRERCEGREAETLCEGVDAGVAEEGDAVVVRGGSGGVIFHCLAGGEGGEVVGFVEVLEDGGGGVEVVAGEVDAAC